MNPNTCWGLDAEVTMSDQTFLPGIISSLEEVDALFPVLGSARP
jgi:hypothetical protein